MFYFACDNGLSSACVRFCDFFFTKFVKLVYFTRKQRGLAKRLVLVAYRVMLSLAMTAWD